MSHIVQIQTELRDPNAIAAACSRLKLPAPCHRSVRLFSSEVEGLAIELPGWQYPVVCHTESGQLHYDNYGGRWGDQAQLDHLLQIYAVEKAKSEARNRGYFATEQQLDNGNIKVQVHAG